MKYEPHDYQKYAISYIETHPVSAVLLDMGLGKTSITLTGLNDLLFDSFEVHRILVIAPLRVARDTWTAESDKWDHLRGLICSVVVGSEAERKAALLKPADIYIINCENVQWLIGSSGVPFDYDTVVVDELSFFKSYQAKRFRALVKVRPHVWRMVGLTGTPSSNGAVYSDTGDVVHIHDRKLEALEDLIEAANGKTVLVAYWFKHDLTRITERLKKLHIPFSRLDTSESIRKWNNGELPVALVHPASAGHGLNLQSGGSTLIWFGLTWSLELYQQTNARLWRQGQTADTVVIQHIVTKGTIDGRILSALSQKDGTQAVLINAVKTDLKT